jgi:IclR family transcriptional regulator, blcABC operon repressor
LSNLPIQNPAVERTVRILDWLATEQSNGDASLAHIARSLELPKSSVHGLLNTLATLDLVRRSAEGQFGLGPRLLQWANAYSNQNDLVRQFLDSAERQPALSQETIMLALLDGSEVLYLGCRAGSSALAVNFKVGGRFPAHCTSSGKAMLSSLDNAQVKKLLGNGPYKRLTDKTPTTAKTLLRDLEVVRSNGYAIDDEETALGMHCFGAAVFGAARTEAVAAVAVSLIKASTTPARQRIILKAITELAADLSKSLGAKNA